MKIANITCSFRSGDGIGNACRARVRGFLAAGHEVLVVTSSSEPWHEPDSRLQCHQVPIKWLQSVTPLPADLLRKLQTTDLLIVDFGSYSSLHPWVRQLACPFVLTYHGLTPNELIDDSVYSSGYMRSVGDLRRFPIPDLVIGDSSVILREYEFLSGQLCSPRKVIPLFGHTRARGSLPQPKSAVIDLLCVGRMYPNKNYELVIEALRLMLARGIPIRLRLIGGGTDPVTKRYQQRLKHLAKGLESSVEFRGYVSEDDLDRCYTECTAVVIPSLHEGFSLPAVEAMMHGKPVFASRLGALPETLGDAAVFFDPFDANSLAEKLAELAKPESTLAVDLSERADRRAMELSEARFVEAYLAVITDLVPPMVDAAQADASPQAPAHLDSNAPQLILSTHRTVGTRLTGEFFARRAQIDWPERLRLRGIVMHEGLVSIVDPPMSAKWIRSGTDWHIRFAVQLADAGDWAEIALMLYDIDRDIPSSEINPCWISSETTVAKAERSYPLASLSMLSRQCFEGRVIPTTSELGWVYRLKGAISNPFISLVYNLLISPQIALMEAIVQRVGSRSLPK